MIGLDVGALGAPESALSGGEWGELGDPAWGWSGPVPRRIEVPILLDRRRWSPAPVVVVGGECWDAPEAAPCWIDGWSDAEIADAERRYRARGAAGPHAVYCQEVSYAE